MNVLSDTVDFYKWTDGVFSKESLFFFRDGALATEHLLSQDTYIFLTCQFSQHISRKFRFSDGVESGVLPIKCPGGSAHHTLVSGIQRCAGDRNDTQ